MTVTDTAIPGVFVIESDAFHDDRGWFTPAWVASELDARGLSARIAQCSMAFNRARGTIRGLHFQAAPFEEVKTVRVLRGAIFDVAVDIRPASPTFKQWVGVELTAANGRMLYVPEGFAHGYQTLDDETEILYFVSTAYSPAHQRGVRWNDPAFGVRWPLGAPTKIHDRDRAYPDFTPTSP
jgi:dTDP-4-dehydrorhamnose 3,5-epimerase